jgi:formamidopyrimidine-DNA glycosylase
MPEAPEVEAVVRALRPLVVGRTIRSCRVIHPISVKPQSPASFARSIRANTILAVTRHGKYLLLELSRGILVFHFKFDGQLYVFSKSPPRRRHIDVVFNLDRGTLCFVDPRHLGNSHWYPDAASVAGLRALGVDVFSREFTSAVLAEILRASKPPVKLAITNQSKLAGLGNIYSSESLWRARIDPRRPGRALAPLEIRRLHKAIVSTAHAALECCSSPPPDFRKPDWWFADLSRILRVYGLEGKPCRHCGKPIKRIEQGGRSTYFCPNCQK